MGFFQFTQAGDIYASHYCYAILASVTDRGFLRPQATVKSGSIIRTYARHRGTCSGRSSYKKAEQPETHALLRY